MRLMFRKWRITAKTGYYEISENIGKDGKTKWASKGVYPSTLASALKYVMDMDIAGCDCKDAKALMRRYDGWVDELAKAAKEAKTWQR